MNLTDLENYIVHARFKIYYYEIITKNNVSPKTYINNTFYKTEVIQGAAYLIINHE